MARKAMEVVQGKVAETMAARHIYLRLDTPGIDDGYWRSVIKYRLFQYDTLKTPFLNILGANPRELR